MLRVGVNASASVSLCEGVEEQGCARRLFQAGRFSEERSFRTGSRDVGLGVREHKDILRLDPLLLDTGRGEEDLVASRQTGWRGQRGHRVKGRGHTRL